MESNSRSHSDLANQSQDGITQIDLVVNPLIKLSARKGHCVRVGIVIFGTKQHKLVPLFRVHPVICQQLSHMEADLDLFVNRVRVRIREIEIVDGVGFVGEEGEGITGRLFLTEA